MWNPVKKILLKFKYFKALNMGIKYLNDIDVNLAEKLNITETKKVKRTEIINFLSEYLGIANNYLEIGVRNPNDNFNLIKAKNKNSVDPGIEYKKNPVDFKMTSDEFFNKLKKNEILSKGIKFDLIFIDGLHKSFQVEKDIMNSLNFLSDNGFIIVHDCNPPTFWHSSEDYFRLTPAGNFWNGTTWKAFLKIRSIKDIFSCCIDADFGVGIISKKINFGKPYNLEDNFYFEYEIFSSNKIQNLNLISWEDFKILIKNH